MTTLAAFVRRFWVLVRNLTRRHATDAELSADVDAYVQLLADENIAAGMAPDAALRAARAEVGGVESVKEAVREVRAGSCVAQWWQDTRYAIRLARRDTGFTAVVVLTLALGIGANTAIFSVVHAVLIEPLPYPEADRLVVVWERNAAAGKDRDPVAPLNFQDWRARNTTFDELGAYRVESAALSGIEPPEQIVTVTMSSSVFRVLDVDPRWGRTFTEQEERQRARVVVLNDGFWRRRFSADAGVIGRAMTLDGEAFTVVGVMPPEFVFPDGNPADVYVPLVFEPADTAGRRSQQSRVIATLSVIGRLADDATIEAAAADLGAIAQSIAAQEPGSNPEVSLTGAHQVLVEDIRRALIVLLATVGLVLIVACANVANLLLVRSASRRREIAVRVALGAARGRIIRQLLSESVLLALLGALSGLTLAWALLRLLARIRPPDLVRIDEVNIDPTVLLFTLAAALCTSVVFGLIPALAASRRVNTVAADENPLATRTAVSGRTRSIVLVCEIALSLMLLAGAGLMIRSVLKLQAVNLGFDAANVITAQIALPAPTYPVDPVQYRPQSPGRAPVPDSKRATFFNRLEEALLTMPGIESVGIVSSLPLNPVGVDYDLPVVVEGRPRPRLGEDPQADFRVATTGYFRTMRIPIRRGRDFTAFDGPNSVPVVIINETMAREIFPGENPLGRRLILYGRAREIIAVVGSVKHRGFSGEPRPEMTLPYRQFQLGEMTLVMRGNLDSAAAAETIRNAVRSLDSVQPVSRVRAMEAFLADSTAQPRFTTLLLSGFALLALTLAVVGIYGVMSYTVNQRARELGLRVALGADRGQVVWMVVHRGLTLAAAGITAGLLGALAGTRLLTGLLFGVTATDPATLTACVVVLGITSLAAAFVPAIRASRIAPAIVLKAE
jgi:putative ABC transport system permease protein